ncbi:pentatricopeptide repeat-containing protein [Quercus suber]|uniref:Pentatricopeptide repeat-containing protein n=1 Tax=Quercus suber TaxID=58331 RepID=A0AAW0LKA5_QUESU
MKKDYCMAVNVRHCACIVDLLGRAGKLADAEKFILNSGFEEDPVMWRALLSACRVYKDSVTGKRVAERVIGLEPQGSASYVLLYNIYNDAGINLPATKIRELMKDRGVKKEPGLSWIEVGNEVHCFVVGDRSHPMSQVIYARLEEMMKRIEKLGYIEGQERPISSISEPKLNASTVMNYHSEKLAVTYGILSLPASAPVRVMKNLRVCQDCHTMIKFLSRVEKREIILRDSIRFHHFREVLRIIFISVPLFLWQYPEHKQSISIDERSRSLLQPKEINYNNYTIRVVDSGIQKDNYFSALSYFFYRYDFSSQWSSLSYDYYRQNYNARIVVFLSCEKPVNTPFYLDTSTCNDNGEYSSNSSISHSKRYKYVTIGTIRAKDVEDSCKLEQMVMTSWPGSDNPDISCTEVHNKLVYGFELSWIDFFVKVNAEEGAVATLIT